MTEREFDRMMKAYVASRKDSFSETVNPKPYVPEKKKTSIFKKIWLSLGCGCLLVVALFSAFNISTVNKAYYADDSQILFENVASIEDLLQGVGADIRLPNLSSDICLFDDFKVTYFKETSYVIGAHYNTIIFEAEIAELSCDILLGNNRLNSLEYYFNLEKRINYKNIDFFYSSNYEEVTDTFEYNCTFQYEDITYCYTVKTFGEIPIQDLCAILI